MNSFIKFLVRKYLFWLDDPEIYGWKQLKIKLKMLQWNDFRHFTEKNQATNENEWFGSELKFH